MVLDLMLAEDVTIQVTYFLCVSAFSQHLNLHTKRELE